MDNLIGIAPEAILIHGPKKLMVSKYLWHSPNDGVIASYSPKDIDVEDHFGIFRGVDMIESFAQSAIVSCGAYLETVKINCTFDDLKRDFIPLFISVGQVNFYSYIEMGDIFINVGQIQSNKFRQMVCDGRIYKAPKGLDLEGYFKSFTREDFLAYNFAPDFKLVAELTGITGRAIKKEKFKY